MIQRKRFQIAAAIFAVILCAGAVLSGCAKNSAEDSQKYITIGCVAPLTGELSAFAEGSLETEEAAVAELNESGGIYIDTLEKKMKICFTIADSASTADGAKEAAKKLIEEEHADVVICSSGSLTAVAAAVVCEASKVPFFAVGAEQDLWKYFGPYQYCFDCAYDNESRFLALKDMLNARNLSSVGLLSVKADSTEIFTNALSEFCKNNGLAFTAAEPLDPNMPDYQKAAAALSAAKPDALICYMDGSDFSKAFSEGGLSGLGIPFVALLFDDLYAGDLTKLEHGNDIKEFYTVTTWDRKYPFTSSLTDETASELALWWESNFMSTPSALTGEKHAAAEIAVDAMKLAMAMDPEAIASAARSLNVDTTLGLVDFDGEGSSILPCSVIQWSYDPMTLSWSRELVSHSQLIDVEFDEG